MLRQGLLYAALGVAFLYSTVNGDLNTVECDSSPIDITFLFDVTPTNESVFEVQKQKVLNVIRHLESSTKGRSKFYSLIAFGRSPISLLELASPFSGSAEKLVQQLSLIRPSLSESNETSVAKAMEKAAKELMEDGHSRSKRLVFLVHNGVNTDLVAETLEAVSSLEKQEVVVFGMDGDADVNTFALQGYSGDTHRVLSIDSDITVFNAAIDEATGACMESSIENSSAEDIAKAKEVQTRLFSLRARDDIRKKRKFSPDQLCSQEKIDLMIVLDTSGSVFNAFKEERQFAIDLIESLKDEVFNQNVQVSIIRFSAIAENLVPFQMGRSKEEILKTLKEIPFTGQNTRIASAVNLGVDELEKHQREDARQFFILISDGHGQEYWNVVQSTGKKLQETDWEVFSVTASRDFNFPELMLYTGDDERVFVGAKGTSFLPTVTQLIDRCLSNNGKGTSLTMNNDDKKMLKHEKTALAEKDSEKKTTVAEVKPQSTTATPQVIIMEVKPKKRIEEKLTDSTKLIPQKEVSTGTADATTQTTAVRDTQKESSEEKTTSEPKQETAEPKTETAQPDNKTVEPKKEKNESKEKKRSNEVTEEETTASASKEETTQKSLEEIELEGSGEGSGDTGKTHSETEGSGFEEPGMILRDETTTTIVPQMTKKHEKEVPETIVTVPTKEEKKDTIVLSPTTEDIVESTTPEISASNDNETTTENIVNATIKKEEKEEEEVRTSTDNTTIDNENVTKEVKEVETTPSTTTLSTTPSEDETTEKDTDCDVDVILLVDRSQSVDEDFKKEIKTAVDTINLATHNDYDSGKVRVGAVSFARDATVELPLQKNSRENITEAIRTIFHTGGTTSAVTGFDTATRNLLPNRRPGARLLWILISDGHSQDFWRQLIISAKAIHAVPNSIVLAATTSWAYSQAELQTWTGEADLVYHSQRIPYFLGRVRNEITLCGDKKQAGTNGITSEIGKSVDSPNSVVAKEEEAQVVTTSVTTEIPEDVTSSTQSDISTVEATTEEPALTTVEGSGNGSKATTQTSAAPASATRAPEGNNVKESVDGSATEVSVNIPSDTHIQVARDISNPSEKNIEKSESEKQTSTENTEKLAQQLIVKEKEPSAFNGEGPCNVDLVFVIDVSTSVEGEFQKQLQFAVDLIKRLPSDAFTSRVNVATVTFNNKGKVMWKLGEIRSRDEILDRLMAIPNTGGSTSVSSGVDLAVEEIERGRRRDARQMVVLVSDGNSQDHWNEVIRSSNGIRSTKADVYAVTVSKDYMFRELELYAGNKWFVYIDARIRQFLDEAETSLLTCVAPSVPKTLETVSVVPVELNGTKNEEKNKEEDLLPIPLPFISIPECETKLVDILFIIDTSSSVETDFYKEKSFAEDLVKVLPEKDFESRISVAIIRFASHSIVHTQFGKAPKREDVLYELSRVEHTGGQTSLTSAVSEGIEELKNRRRSNARTVVVIVSDGNSQDKWEDVKKTSSALRSIGAEIYTVTLSEKFYLDELKEYSGAEEHVYAGDRIGKFIKDVGASVVNCPQVNNTNDSSLRVDKALDSVPLNLVQRDSKVIRPIKKCKYNKMDLEIILDASASREEVFEHQRELALSLIERLPISEEGTTVSIGITSFTSLPTIRQNIGLGRDKKTIRKAIEDIEYHGGSTLTAQAVQLTVDDLLKGKRDDAIQVVVLMNDGLSQDPWDSVLSASQKLASTRAERFGVALGPDIDLRELVNYIGNEERIYRDGTTEQFLNDVSSLLSGEKECQLPIEDTKNNPLDSSIFPSNSLPIECTLPNLDIIVLFDNSDETANLTDPFVNSNRYLILDVLGSLTGSPGRVRVSIISLASQPKIELDFTDVSQRDLIFAKTESIKSLPATPQYSKGISLGLETIEKVGRSDARKALVIVGDGQTDEAMTERDTVVKRIREIPSLNCLAVDSSRNTNIDVLKRYTGDEHNVYDYDRNAKFAKEILQMSTFMDSSQCKVSSSEQQDSPVQTIDVTSRIERSRQTVLRDVKTHENLLDKDIISANKVIIKKPKATTESTTQQSRDTVSTVKFSRTSRSTTVSTTTVTEQTPRKVFKGAPTVELTPAPTRFPPVTPRLSTSTTTVTRSRSIPSSTTTTRRENTQSRDFERTQTVRIRKEFSTTTEIPEENTPFVSGCLIDVLIILDASGSVEETFIREKQLVADILEKLRIGPNNAKVALIKFAAKEKVRTMWSFNDIQSKGRILRTLHSIPFSSGTTAIHSALLQAVTEYSAQNGARPTTATPIAIVFTDGFGQKSIDKEATLLRHSIPNTFAVAINHEFPISRSELNLIAGDSERVYTDRNIEELHKILAKHTRDCRP